MAHYFSPVWYAAYLPYFWSITGCQDELEIIALTWIILETQSTKLFFLFIICTLLYDRCHHTIPIHLHPSPHLVQEPTDAATPFVKCRVLKKWAAITYHFLHSNILQSTTSVHKHWLRSSGPTACGIVQRHIISKHVWPNTKSGINDGSNGADTMPPETNIRVVLVYMLWMPCAIFPFECCLILTTLHSKSQTHGCICFNLR